MKGEINLDYQNNQVNRASDTVDISKHLVLVYGWMFLGLVLTGITSLVTLFTPLNVILSNRILFYGVLISEFVLVLVLSSRIMKQSYKQAAFWFVIYSLLNGITLSVIFYRYPVTSIILSFFIAAGFFGFMSVYGIATKADLSSWGNLLFMGLIGIIIAMIANVFIGSSQFDYIISFIGVAIFLGLTAYDNQKIKKMYNYYRGTDKEKNIAVAGALMLYLDLINMFLFILRILGRKR